MHHSKGHLFKGYNFLRPIEVPSIVFVNTQVSYWGGRERPVQVGCLWRSWVRRLQFCETPALSGHTDSLPLPRPLYSSEEWSSLHELPRLLSPPHSQTLEEEEEIHRASSQLNRWVASEKICWCCQQKGIKTNQVYTVEPPNKGHFGANSVVPCRKVVPISEVK